ncbi:cold shock domain-containing protein CspD [Pseudomonas sp. B21-012]|uniref:cold shock domain-containing protein CspD n=1 Tax=Pseudomonas sp. B21-012 TaxID=2895472 RepID=UPI00215F277B|nr:cold shock domain-containing protein CspD [Pseudomonas sp. B21-012]UVM57837.1 cold shock domain-containing protein CspD [Pseudomonas sp. B21-012]
MASGKVKWFNNAKGYGFINEDGKIEDLFAHYSAIQMEGYKTLKAGQPVNFDIIQGPKGLHAVNIESATAPTTASPTPSPQTTEA